MLDCTKCDITHLLVPYTDQAAGVVGASEPRPRSPHVPGARECARCGGGGHPLGGGYGSATGPRTSLHGARTVLTAHRVPTARSIPSRLSAALQAHQWVNSIRPISEGPCTQHYYNAIKRYCYFNAIYLHDFLSIHSRLTFNLFEISGDHITTVYVLDCLMCVCKPFN